MVHIQIFEELLNKKYSPISSSLFYSIVNRVSTCLDFNVKYTTADVAKIIASCGVASMHSNDNSIIVEILKDQGFLIN